VLGQEEQAPDHMFLCSYPGSAESVSAYGKLGLTHKACGWRGIKTPDFTYVITNGYMPDEKQEEYLYDDRNDPWQLQPKAIERDCKDPR
jgi:uncharacterized sulfatase